MDAAKTLKDFKKFLKNNQEKLYRSSIPASEIKPDDEWMQEDVWDKIYQKEVQKNAKI
jgi:hypothetical protein